MVDVSLALLVAPLIARQALVPFVDALVPLVDLPGRAVHLRPSPGVRAPARAAAFARACVCVCLPHPYLLPGVRAPARAAAFAPRSGRVRLSVSHRRPGSRSFPLSPAALPRSLPSLCLPSSPISIVVRMSFIALYLLLLPPLQPFANLPPPLPRFCTLPLPLSPPQATS